MCITHRHRHQCSNGQREGEGGLGGGWQRGGSGDICTNVNKKSKGKKPRGANGMHNILMRTYIVVIVCLESYLTWTSIFIISKAREFQNL